VPTRRGCLQIIVLIRVEKPRHKIIPCKGQGVEVVAEGVGRWSWLGGEILQPPFSPGILPSGSGAKVLVVEVVEVIVWGPTC